MLYGGNDEPRSALVSSGAPAGPAFSPDGDQVAFSWDRGNGPALWLVGVNGLGLERLTDGRDDSEPSWSPDGRHIVFSRGCDLWIVDPAGGIERRLTQTRYCEISPAWRPRVEG